MKHEIEESQCYEINEQINDLDELLTERISELHEVKGMQQCRHAYVYYRSLLWGIRDTFNKSHSQVKNKP